MFDYLLSFTSISEGERNVDDYVDLLHNCGSVCCDSN